MFDAFYGSRIHSPWESRWLNDILGCDDNGVRYIGGGGDYAWGFINDYVTPLLVNTWQEQSTYYEKVQAVKKSSPSPLLLSLIQRMGK
jgi:hypothetical protein